MGLAIVYRVTVLDLLRDTDPEKAKPQGLFHRQPGSADMAEQLEPHGTCLACDIGAGSVKRFGGMLVHDIVDADMQNLLLDCGGLCLPHLRDVLSQKMRTHAYEALIQVQRKVWQNIMGELEEFIRKNDYRFLDEVLSEEEGTSWSRVLDVIVGKKS